MISKFFCSRKRGRTERPSFRPTLETLEKREVPTASQASAAFDSFPTDTSNLVASLQARPVDTNAINADLAVVSSDVALLAFSARNFVVSDRLRIDNALVTNGFILLFQAYNNFPAVPAPEFLATARLGASAIESGALDFLITGFFPQTSDDAVLT